LADVRLENLHKTFDGNEVISGIDLSVADGEFCVFLGPSGCGKSTLLRLIAGLEAVTSGSVHIGGRDVTGLPPQKRDLAMVFQSYALYPHMNVFENMAFGLKFRRRSRHDIKQRVRSAAHSLHIEHLLERKPAELSGGQRQRVAIGRAIVKEPRVFLFDEPLSNLDADLRMHMRLEFARLRQRLNTTMIYVTHDQVEAMTLADRMVVIRDGRIAQAGAPLEIYQAPRNLFVARFIGSPRMNLIPARVVQVDPASTTVVLGDGSRVRTKVQATKVARDNPVTLGIRPEHTKIPGGETNTIQGEVVMVERLGDHTLVYVEWQGSEDPLVVRIPDGPVPRLGERQSVSLPIASCHLFASDGSAIDPLSSNVKQAQASPATTPS
jgi:multiple sugar transport system ATP-binding protein